jgi:hypothetical protein
LLSIQATDVSIRDTSLIKAAVFDASQWNASKASESTVVSMFSGINRENLTQPDWSGDTFVVEPFRLATSETRTNITYSATTIGMYPGLSCDEANFPRDPVYYNDSIDFLRANVTYRSPTCEVEATNIELADPTQRDQRRNRWEADNYMGGVKVVDCSGNKRLLITVTQTNRSLKITSYRYVTCF